MIAYEDAVGEGWCDCWPAVQDLGGKLLEVPPKIDTGHIALHGVRLGSRAWHFRRTPFERDRQWVQRCDVRFGPATVSMARSQIGTRGLLSGGGHSDAMNIAGAAVEMTARGALEGHFADSEAAQGPLAVYYLGSALSSAPVDDAWRDAYPGTVVSWQHGMRVDLSVAELLRLDEVIIPAWRNEYGASGRAPIG